MLTDSTYHFAEIMPLTIGSEKSRRTAMMAIMQSLDNTEASMSQNSLEKASSSVSFSVSKNKKAKSYM